MDIQNLVLQLKGKGLTQVEIGKEIGCEQSTVSDIENGKIGKVRPSHKIVVGLEKLAEKHGIELQ